VFANERGEILDVPELSAAGRSGRALVALDRRELVPLPEGSELYLLPGRQALGFLPRGQSPAPIEGSAVAAFLPPGYSVSALAAFDLGAGAPLLPLYTYAALSWYRGAFHVAAERVESDAKHDPGSFAGAELAARVAVLRARHPANRLVEHLGASCALRYGCANAKNLFLGRWECPIPVASVCNARCVGCISAQPEAEIPAPQERLAFVPSVAEVLEIALPHLESAPLAMLSFGQGCEGEPLMQAELLVELVRAIRARTQRGTLHLNTNASKPAAVARLAQAGLDSIRVSLNSAREVPYTRYYRPLTYRFEDVRETLRVAARSGLYTSLNYLSFPGFTDTEEELDALRELLRAADVGTIQWRNLNIDPDAYARTVELGAAPGFGMRTLRARLSAEFPRLRHGYVNPPREAWGRLGRGSPAGRAR
jgi:wyosine [tRNA(Phe)-imidazoG37] synthetase (radical SAM superfamily)